MQGGFDAGSDYFPKVFLFCFVLSETRKQGLNPLISHSLVVCLFFLVHLFSFLIGSLTPTARKKKNPSQTAPTDSRSNHRC